MTQVDARPHLCEVRITPEAVHESRPPLPTGMVTLSAPAPVGGCEIRLASNRPGVIDVPSTVTIPEGAVVAFFVLNITTAPSAAMITASLGEDEDKCATVSVLPTEEISPGRRSAAMAIEQPANTITTNGTATPADLEAAGVGVLAPTAPAGEAQSRAPVAGAQALAPVGEAQSPAAVGPAQSPAPAGVAVAAGAVLATATAAAAVASAGAVPAVVLGPADRIAQVRTRLALARLDDAGQTELARLAHALDGLAHQRLYELIGDVEMATSLLLAETPQVIAAAGIRQNIENALGPYTLVAFLRRNSSIGNVALGLATLVLAATALVGLLIVPDLKPGAMLAGMDATLLVLVGLAGALGSVISVMYRITDFNDESVNSSLLLFFTGLFKPIIGVGFALFVFVALSAKLTTLVQPAADTVPYFYAALGFLAGFIEKFAPDLIDTVGKAVEGSSTTPATPPAARAGA
jgi:hypothetical protein